MTTEPTPLVIVLPCDGERTFALMEAIRDKLLPRAFHEVEQVVADNLAAHRLAALEAAAKVADERAEMRRRLYEETPVSINAAKAVEAEEIASAIRALSNKGGRDGE